MEIITRTHTGLANDFDLREIANQALVAADIVKNQTANLELLDSRKDQLRGLTELYKTLAEVLSSEEFALLQGSRKNLLLLKEQEDNLKRLSAYFEADSSATGFRKLWNKFLNFLGLKYPPRGRSPRGR